MYSINNARFDKSETTGSVGYLRSVDNQTVAIPKANLNFRGEPDSFEYQNAEPQKKSISPWTIVGGLVLTGCAIVGGLGYTHKKELIKNMSDGKIKDLLMKLEPAGEKCHKWCSSIKNTGSEWWSKVKDFCGGKKD